MHKGCEGDVVGLVSIGGMPTDVRDEEDGESFWKVRNVCFQCICVRIYLLGSMYQGAVALDLLVRD